MKKNKPDIPPEMRPQKDREVFTSKFGFRKDMMIASYVPKQKRQLLCYPQRIQMQASTKRLETSKSLQL